MNVVSNHCILRSDCSLAEPHEFDGGAEDACEWCVWCSKRRMERIQAIDFCYMLTTDTINGIDF